MATAKKNPTTKTKKARVQVRDLKPARNPKGGWWKKVETGG